MMRTVMACVQHRDEQKSAAVHKRLYSRHLAREPCASESTVSIAEKVHFGAHGRADSAQVCVLSADTRRSAQTHPRVIAHRGRR